MANGGSSVEELFAEFLRLQETRPDCSIEDFCREHAAEADGLRELNALKGRLLAGLASPEARDTIPAGTPSIFVIGDDDTQAWSDLIDRLKTRGPAYRRYRIVGERIGRGGMGEVFRAVDEDTRRVVALKRIRADLVGPEGDEGYVKLRARFLEEAQISAQLDHPGIVPVHEMGVDGEGRIYFTMKLVKGESLREFLARVEAREAGFTLTRAVSILLNVCEAVAFAHAKGVIHRDLKPDNVMIGAFGETYVMDWGLARVLGAGSSATTTLGTGDDPAQRSNVRTVASEDFGDSPRAMLTDDRQQLGTPYYMSPEQAEGLRGQVSRATDVYAAGAILYQTLAGAPPYHDATSRRRPAEVIADVRRGPPPAVSTVAPNAPAELISICEKAMARRPEDRYGEMRELAADLRAYLENRVVSAHPSGAWRQLRKWVARNRGATSAIAASLLATVAGTIASVEVSANRGLAAANLVAEAARETAEADRRRADGEANAARLAKADSEAQREAADVAKRRAEVAATDAEREKVAAVRATERAEAARGEIERQREEAERQRAAAETATGTANAARDEARKTLAALDDANRELTASRTQALEYLRIATNVQARALAREGAELWPPKPLLAARMTMWIDVAGQVLAAREQLWPPDDPQAVSLADRELRETINALEGDDPRGPTLTSLRARLARARAIERVETESRDDWDAVLTAIADEKAHPVYRGTRIHRVPELAPIDRTPNPQTGLFEFWCPFTGTKPERDADGYPRVRGETAIVFALIPPGECFLGAQNKSRWIRNYDRNAIPLEFPQHLRAKRVAACFVATHELTRAQRLQLLGESPSADTANERDADLPTSAIAFSDAVTLLSLNGMDLPTEVEWEYATRARTGSHFWFGDLPENSGQVANLEERPRYNNYRFGSSNQNERNREVDHSDGYHDVAPVGTFQANAFGLFDVVGNVAEWAHDSQSQYIGEVDSLSALPVYWCQGGQSPAADCPYGNEFALAIHWRGRGSLKTEDGELLEVISPDDWDVMPQIAHDGLVSLSNPESNGPFDLSLARISSLHHAGAGTFEQAAPRVCRGGSCRSLVAFARSAARDIRLDAFSFADVGVRPLIRAEAAR